MKTDKTYAAVIFTLFLALIGLIYYIVTMDNQVENQVEKVSVGESKKTGSSLSHYTPLPRSSPLPKEKEYEETESYTEDFEPTGVFSSIWAYDENNLFVGGMNGAILRYDGKKLVKFKSDFNGWIFCLTGKSPEKVYAACQDSLVMRFDGKQWEKFKQFDSKNRFLTIWTPKDKNVPDIFVGGDYGNIYHYDGMNWTKMDSGVNSRVWCLWGTSKDNLYAAIHEKERILHYDGKKWTPVLIPDSEKCTFYSVFGFSENDIYAGGDEGTLAHFDGKKWEISKNAGFKRADFIKSISGSSSTDLYLCSYFGKIIHWNGKESETVSTQVRKKCFYGIWSVSKDCVFAVGDDGVINRFNGKEWKRLTFGNPNKRTNEEQSPKSIQSVDNNQYPIIHCVNKKWIPQKDVTDLDLVGVWGTSNDNVFAVGNAGAIFHFDGKKWRQQESPAIKTLYSVRGSAPESVFACGVGGTIVHYVRGKWETMDSGTEKGLTSLWFASPNKGFAAGFEGTLLQYDGKEWKQAIDPKKVGFINFSDIWGFSEDNVYVIGDLGTLYHYNGKDWKKIPMPTTKWLLSAWGSDKHNLFIGAEDGLILHVDGEKVTQMDAGVITCIFGLWGSSGSNVYGIAGDGGAIVHYDGKKWQQIAAADGYLCDIWGTGENSFFIVGEGKE